MSWTLPLTDVELSEEDVAAYLSVLESGWLTMGPRTREFEGAFAERFGAEHAVALSSGTASLHLALLAAGVGDGDEVLVPAMTFVGGAAAVRYCGAHPLLVESIGPEDLNLDPIDAERRITPRTRAVLATHWLGYACDLAALERLCRQHDLILIEDCAHSVTARDSQGRLTGTVGAAGCFSFFSKKQLAVGEGGMILTSDEAIARTARSLRSHAMTSMTWDRHRGHAESYDVVDVGFNFRIDEPRAALGLSRLGRLDADVARRRQLVRRYRERLAAVAGVTLPWTDEEVERSSHFGFAIVFDDGKERDRIARELDRRGIQTTRYPALTSLSAYRDHDARPRTEELAARHLLLPLSSTYTERAVDLVVGHLTDALAAASAAS
ncbi:MAG TPA: DegT/DnrJ/EryC1/StrS family aminotransferase [Solirubrobacteraceae bacterium]|nr:DegT/DnrJ/EryC1/StrS family aminotransferase [Solirubrobacteraceae bacterium]